MINAVLGVTFTALLLLAMVIRGVFGALIAVLGVVVVVLVLVLRSFFRPAAAAAIASLHVPFGDTRLLFAQSARTATSGEILVSYSRYKLVYRAMLLSLVILVALLGAAVVVGILRVGYPVHS